MYHAVVRRKVRHAFSEINEGRYETALAAFSSKPRHIFYGRHAMGGVREGFELTQSWYARLPRLIPDLKFDLHRIQVGGWPWNTVVFVEWSDRFDVDGKPTGNHGVHRMTMKWGKVTEMAIYCDTQRLAEVLRAKAISGNPEAAMPEIGIPAT